MKRPPCADYSHRVWNCDETVLASLPKQSWQRKENSSFMPLQKGQIGHTLQFIAVDLPQGHVFHPIFSKYLIYKDWMAGGPAGVLYGVSDSGWMEQKNIQDWFTRASFLQFKLGHIPVARKPNFS